MFFIHTFSMIKVFKKREEVEQLWKIYNQKNITEKKVFRINEFSDKGVRLVIRDLEKQRKRFEKVTTEVEIIVTPYKLLHNGEALGRLTTEEEYTEAIQECSIYNRGFMYAKVVGKFPLHKEYPSNHNQEMPMLLAKNIGIYCN